MPRSNSGISLYAAGCNVAINRCRVSNSASINLPCPDTRVSISFVGHDVTVHGRGVSNGSAIDHPSCTDTGTGKPG
ncbi:hypothetical protein ACTL6P_14540 [Endozoicomonas acroporae]|uniref:hypothetical protein n=1 Tax=Endozoicomonas acroporae TaxID=1701104 RepID=UPI003F8CE874